MSEITIVRVLDAPREAVWRAWTDPDELASWWGKRGWTAVRSSIVMDVRPGGRFYVMTLADDGSEMPTDGVYREVVDNERIVFAEGERIGSVTFSDMPGGRTEMIFHATIHATDKLREQAEGGLRSAFDRLAETLEAG